MIPKRAIILASGASIRQGLWDTPIENLPVWGAIRNELIISCNWGFKWCNPTVQMFTDYRFYCLEKERLDKLGLLVTNKDGFYESKNRYGKYFDSVPNHMFFLKPCSAQQRTYHGKDSWTKGFYTVQLTGLLALSFALTIGCDEIYLLGFDANESNGRTHFYQGDKDKTGYIFWNNQHQTGVGKNDRGYYNTGNYNKDMDWWYQPLSVTDAKIYNVSPNSKISVFPKIDYLEFYDKLHYKNDIVQSVVQKEIMDLIHDNNIA